MTEVHFTPFGVLQWTLLSWLLWRAMIPRAKEDPARGMDWKWWGLVGATLFSFRWPFAALPHALYPDESQMIAGALTLAHDPLFWRSVDGGTAGPLDFYPLLPAALVHGVASYTVARVIAMIVIWGTLVAVGETLTLIASRSLARIAVLPYLLFEALITSAEFTHYSTELVPALMLAWAAFLIVRQSLKPSAFNLWMTSLILGAVPLSKLQAAPIALTVGALLGLQELLNGRQASLMKVIAGLGLPSVAVGLIVTLTGQIENLVIPYFLQNSVYVSVGDLSLHELAALMWMQSARTGYLACWWTGSVGFLLIAGFCVKFTSRQKRDYAVGAGIFLLAALLCIYFPRRPYHHYLSLAFVPLSLLTGICLSCLAISTRRASWLRQLLPRGFFVICVVGSQLAFRAIRPIDAFETYNHREPKPESLKLTELIRSYADSGEALGIWGWRSDLYVETGLWQATRQAHSEAQLVRGKWEQYFLRVYFEDLDKSAPPVFVDTVGPGNFRFTNRAMAHEYFPALSLWLTIHYNQVADLDGVRVYVRNDRLIARRATTIVTKRP